jgi:hypothetical protein
MPKKKENMNIEEQHNKAEELLKKYDKVLNIVGRDNFIFYDDENDDKLTCTC